MEMANDVYSQALNLPADQRGELAHLLLESLPEEQRPIELNADYEAELRQRISDIDSGRAKMLALAEVMQRLEGPSANARP